MSDPATVTCAKHWYLPIANEAGCVSLFELTNGTFALTLESTVQHESGVIVSAELAQLIKDELVQTAAQTMEINPQ
ncbi:hypothetical protein PhaeoP75_01101 [Phaeobacter gallaeciensis]|uniref:hypothetical protein n=1 Tax=Phaeobacter gallaeciensis TaxID=60890 RepID=UPI000BBC115A|nr:hypothetical protein [Phaeobacter gallaeciensis]ATF00760.1 hypothetical protein PhaeoP75_01101 [Phaeobacter gallaeciensis]